jgi:hypothetical protein
MFKQVKIKRRVLRITNQVTVLNDDDDVVSPSHISFFRLLKLFIQVHPLVHPTFNTPTSFCATLLPHSLPHLDDNTRTPMVCLLSFSSSSSQSHFSLAFTVSYSSQPFSSPLAIGSPFRTTRPFPVLGPRTQLLQPSSPRCSRRPLPRHCRRSYALQIGVGAMCPPLICSNPLTLGVGSARASSNLRKS